MNGGQVVKVITLGIDQKTKLAQLRREVKEAQDASTAANQTLRAFEFSIAGDYLRAAEHFRRDIFFSDGFAIITEDYDR